MSEFTNNKIIITPHSVTNNEELQNLMSKLEKEGESQVLNGFKFGKLSLPTCDTNKNNDIGFKTTNADTSSTTITNTNQNDSHPNTDEAVGFLRNIMQKGGDEFKEKTGRNMTYSEMRSMYG